MFNVAARFCRNLGIKLTVAGNGASAGAAGDKLTDSLTWVDIPTEGMVGIKIRFRVELVTGGATATVGIYDAEACTNASITSSPPALLSDLHGGNSGLGEKSTTHVLSATGNDVITCQLDGSVKVARVGVLGSSNGLAAGDKFIAEISTVEG